MFNSISTKKTIIILSSISVLILGGILFQFIKASFFKYDYQNNNITPFVISEEIKKVQVESMKLKKTLSFSEKSQIEEFKNEMQFEFWLGIEEWDLKSEPSKFFIINEDIVLGIIKNKNDLFVRVTYIQTENKINKYKYYKVPQSVDNYFDEIIKK